jgi:uncharacterized alpha/beta hydrolase family protein
MKFPYHLSDSFSKYFILSSNALSYLKDFISFLQQKKAAQHKKFITMPEAFENVFNYIVKRNLLTTFAATELNFLKGKLKK